MGGRRSARLLVAAAMLVGCGQADEAGEVAGGGTRPAGRGDGSDDGVGKITVRGIEYRARQVGELPAAGVASVGGISLPVGRPVRVDPSYAWVPENAPSEPVAWVTDQPVADIGTLWSELAAQFPETGLWPIGLEPLVDGHRWWDGELDPTISRQLHELGGVDLESTLAGWWSDTLPAAEDLEDPDFAALVDESLAPFGRSFPGLASTPTGDARAEVSVPAVAGHLGLVAVERPADAPSVLGWTGPVNYYEDLGPLTIVLRSWEDRYDAVVVSLGFDTLSMVVRRPPQTEDEASALAAEHFAACPDQVWQGTETIMAYGSTLKDQTTWEFWWD